MSSAIVFPSTVATAYVISSIWGFGDDACASVGLSTSGGVKCGCGKFSIDIKALPIKTMPMGEVCQVAASGFKLTHGYPLQSMNWKTPVF